MVVAMVNTAGFWNELERALAYIVLHILADRRSGLGVIVLTTYAVKIAMYWLGEAWDSWKL